MVRFLFLIIFLITSCASWRIDPEKAALHLVNGNAYFQNQNFALALKEYLAAEESDPDNPAIQNNLGLTYQMKEKYDKAIYHFENALKLDSKFTDARNNLARAYIEIKKYEEGEKLLTIVMNDLTYPSQDRAYINMGFSQFNQKKYSVAKDYFSKAVSMHPDNCVALTYYGRCLFEDKDYDLAVPALDKAIGFCQKLLIDEPHYFSALAYYRIGNVDKSLARFNEILKLYPEGKYVERSRNMIKIIKR